MSIHNSGCSITFIVKHHAHIVDILFNFKKNILILFYDIPINVYNRMSHDNVIKVNAFYVWSFESHSYKFNILLYTLNSSVIS